MPATNPTMEVCADIRAYQQQRRPIQIRRIHPDNAPCKFDGDSQVDVNGACLKCGAGEAEDCRDI